jgi:beta-galactosidase
MRSLPVALAMIALGFTLASSLHGQRDERVLADGWKFVRSDAGLTGDARDWQTVTVPHTWNAIDAQNGKAADPDLPFGYYRGAGWYARSLDVPVAWRGRRVFIRFEAASVAAKVWLNDKELGEHRGAFTAFCFELTSYLRFDGPNELRVRVDNSRDETIPPLSGDFNLYGGLYRPVHLIAADPVCITPLEFASPGVFVRQEAPTAGSARIEVETLVTNGTPNLALTVIEIEIADATGAIVTRGESPLGIAPRSTASVTQSLVIAHPHRWAGRKDPYLYRVTSRVRRDGRVVDSVTQPLGVRTVAISQDDGFLLNGQVYPILGVNRHQDAQDKGWAVSDADHERDFALIAEMGTTAVRLAHYPQAEHVYDIADRLGILLWNEISLVDYVRPTPEFAANAEQQLREMILQRVNHPSVMCWGLFNELRAPDAKVGLGLIRHLNALAKTLDPSRPTVAASNLMSLQEIHFVPDAIAFNAYPGWYGNIATDTMASFLTKRQAELGGKRIALAEYGAGASPTQHEEGAVKRPDTRSHWHPEEWQNLVHEQDWRDIQANRSRVWGTFLWNMFDFAAENRDEGAHPGINDKGLVTRDRTTRKDAFFFYKANWSTEPVVYITSRRLVDRKQPATAVKVYSNYAAVELVINGHVVGTITPDAVKVALWPAVTLQPGVNRIEAIGRDVARGEIRDTCEWTLLAASATGELKGSSNPAPHDLVANKAESPN